jgi:hypothetical protein
MECNKGYDSMKLGAIELIKVIYIRVRILLGLQKFSWETLKEQQEDVPEEFKKVLEDDWEDMIL